MSCTLKGGRVVLLPAFVVDGENVSLIQTSPTRTAFSAQIEFVPPSNPVRVVSDGIDTASVNSHMAIADSVHSGSNDSSRVSSASTTISIDIATKNKTIGDAMKQLESMTSHQATSADIVNDLEAYRNHPCSPTKIEWKIAADEEPRVKSSDHSGSDQPATDSSCLTNTPVQARHDEERSMPSESSVQRKIKSSPMSGKESVQKTAKLSIDVPKLRATLPSLDEVQVTVSAPYSPYPADLQNPIERDMDEFLHSPKFLTICAQSMQLAQLLPERPPPAGFVSLDITPMHQWYASLVIEFLEIFQGMLQKNDIYPQKQVIHRDTNGHEKVMWVADHETFLLESTRHCDKILQSYAKSWKDRKLGSMCSLFIDQFQPTAPTAAKALIMATSTPNKPPRSNWKVGDKLNSEYKRTLRSFEWGVHRILQDSPADRWALGYSQLLKRGIDGYKEYYIRALNEKIKLFTAPAQVKDEGLEVVDVNEVFD